MSNYRAISTFKNSVTRYRAWLGVHTLLAYHTNFIDFIDEDDVNRSALSYFIIDVISNQKINIKNKTTMMTFNLM